MSSPLLRSHWEKEGILPLLRHRAASKWDVAQWRPLLERADLLALGSLADWVRHTECGDEVRVYVSGPPKPSPEVVIVGASDAPARGVDTLRAIAVTRLLGQSGQRIVFDWGALGWDLAQVALRFGATDLAAPNAARRLKSGKASPQHSTAVAIAPRDATHAPVDKAPPNRALPLQAKGGHQDHRALILALVQRHGLRAVFVEADLGEPSHPFPEEHP